MVGDGDGDGWLRARNYKGEEGFVPHNYLDIEPAPTQLVTSGTYHLYSNIHLVSIDNVVSDPNPHYSKFLYYSTGSFCFQNGFGSLLVHKNDGIVSGRCMTNGLLSSKFRKLCF